MTTRDEPAPLSTHVAASAVFVGLPQMAVFGTGYWTPAIGFLAPLFYLGGFLFGRYLR